MARSALSPRSSASARATAASPKYDPLRSTNRLLAAAALAFLGLLSCALSWSLDPPGGPLADPRFLWDAATHSEFFKLLWLLACLAGLGVVMGYFINVNKFSLHALYRNRLIRAFLGASRTVRNPHWFTGFDPNDNFRLGDLKPGRPLHIINIALNLVKGGQLAWQERKAASFSASRLHCGSWLLGYRPSAQFGNGITLGTALAISGAAANPNQGYNSSPLVAFLMTLFNLRLGWWLGNPGGHGARTWDRSGPIHAALPLFNEALGSTNESYAYVNLSDGGHFENLGLYEMVLRRCRHIVAIDAGCDCDYVFEDLGNAIRKIRIDLGVSIDIQTVSPKKAGAEISYYAIGTIHYSQIDGPGTDGTLLYIKPTLCGLEPADVANYAASHPNFPHEPTSDQWFSESQMESYRALGFHAVYRHLQRSNSILDNRGILQRSVPARQLVARAAQQREESRARLNTLSLPAGAACPAEFRFILTLSRQEALGLLILNILRNTPHGGIRSHDPPRELSPIPISIPNSSSSAKTLAFCSLTCYPNPQGDRADKLSNNRGLI